MIPTDSDLIDMSLWSLREHCRELVGKYGQMTPEQRREFREIAMSILTDEKRAAA